MVLVHAKRTDGLVDGGWRMAVDEEDGHRHGGSLNNKQTSRTTSTEALMHQDVHARLRCVAVRLPSAQA